MSPRALDLPQPALGLLLLALVAAAALDRLTSRGVSARRVDPQPAAGVGEPALASRMRQAPSPMLVPLRSRHPGRSGGRSGWRIATRWVLVLAVTLIAVLPTVALLRTFGVAAPAGPVMVPLGLGVAAAASTATWLRSRARARRQAARTRAQVVEACEALASGLRAGLPPERMLARTAEDLALLVPAATAARLGADVAVALRGAAAAPGAGRMAMLASAWEVARRSGAAMADVVSRVATTVRADAGRQRQIEAALGGARSTAQLFAVLPLLGIALGAGMDADPVAVLTGSAIGAWCLCLGTALACLGLVWVEHLAAGDRQ